MIPFLFLFLAVQNYYSRQHKRLKLTEFGRRLDARLQRYLDCGKPDSKVVFRCLMAFKRRIEYTRLLSRGILEDPNAMLYTDIIGYPLHLQPLSGVRCFVDCKTSEFFGHLSKREIYLHAPYHTYSENYKISEQSKKLILEILDYVSDHEAMIDPNSIVLQHQDFFNVLVDKFVKIMDKCSDVSSSADAMDAFVILMWMSRFAMVINDRRVIHLRIPNIILVLYLLEAIMKNENVLEQMTVQIGRPLSTYKVYNNHAINLYHVSFWDDHKFSAMRTRLLADLAANEF
jgi:hypothetical protein